MYETCLHCNKPSSDVNNQECTLCKNITNSNIENDLYIRIGTTNCLSSCDDTNDNYYIKDLINTKCINCKDNSLSTDETIKTKTFHYIGENECIVDPVTEYYIIDEDTGSIDHCYERCLTCTNKEEYEDIIDEHVDTNPNIITQNCDTCKNEYVQYGKECLEECPILLVNISGICRNCAEIISERTNQPMYNYKKECIDTQPFGTDITVPEYNYVKDCGDKCATCKFVNDVAKCYTCKAPYFKKYNSTNSQTHFVTCIPNCNSFYTVNNTSNRECYNCKDNTNLYKYYYNGNCVNFHDGYHENYYEPNDIEKKKIWCYRKMS